MDTSNWRPTPASGEPTVDSGDWRSQFPPNSRTKIVDKIMETLKRHLPFPGDEGLDYLKNIAVKFEEKIYTAASNQEDYLKRISMKMLTFENKAQNSIPGASTSPPDQGSKNMPQVHTQAQTLPIQLQANQTQAHQQLLSQNMQNNIAAPGVQSPGLPTTLPPVSGLSQNPIPGGGSVNTNMQNMSGISQNMVGGSISHAMPANMFPNQPRQMQGRQQVLPQQQQQSQNFMYQQQQLQQLSKQKLQQGNLQHSHMQSQIQQQQNLIQPTQLQSAQQSGMQSSSLMQQPSMQSSLSQNQQSSVQPPTHSMIQHHHQSVLRQQGQPAQTAGLHQQQVLMTQQSLMSQQQQPQTSQQLLQQQSQLMGQQANASTLQQNQFIGQHNNLGDVQQQQQRRLPGKQNNLPNLQQQQQLTVQQNNLSNLHQQQLLGTQPVNSSMQPNQHSFHMLQSKAPLQQTQQTAPNVLPIQGQASHSQQSQHQLMSQMQSQPTQLQHQVGVQQQSNLLQRDMQQRLQTLGQASSSLLPSLNLMDQQKHLYQAQRAVPETSTTSLDSTAQTANDNGGDWQEEMYQKIKAMKEAYLPELNEMHHKINSKVTQHENIPQAAKSEQFEKLKNFKLVLERIISYLSLSKNHITAGYRDKSAQYERFIINFMNSNRPRKPSMQQGQLPQSHMHPMQQPKSQINQARSHDDQMNPQLQLMNLQGTISTMQQSSVRNLQHNSMSSFSGASNTQQTALGQLQPGTDLDSGQGNADMSTMQQGLPSSLRHPVGGPQQANFNTFPSQGGANVLQSNINSQSNISMLQYQHLKQPQDQLMLQSQHLKQQYQRHQYIAKQQLLRQQQVKQQLHAQFQTHQIPQLYQMNEANDMKMRQGINVKPGDYQHLQTHRPDYTHPQLKPAAQLTISSPQLLQAASPLLHQHSSLQVDQQNLLSSITKAGTPLQSGNLPFVVPSPSTPIAPSPMPGDTEKPIAGTSSLSNVGNIENQQTTGTQGLQSLAIVTPGISASPLLAEFTGADGLITNTVATGPGKSNVTKQPIERLIKAVNSLSSNALDASVSEIGSVVSMIDRISGSAPGNGSRAAVGEDLVAMTKCCLRARNFIARDGVTGTKKIRRYTSAVPLCAVSSTGSGNDSFKQLTILEASDMESTATSNIKRPKLEANHALLEEIRDINQQLIDTVVDISDEDFYLSGIAAADDGGEGTIVKCSFNAVALSPSLKSQYASTHMSPIQPLRLLVPSSYPSCSPVLLDKFPVEVSSKEYEYEDLSVKAKSRFSLSLRSLSQPMSLEEIARTWDVCAHAVISEYAQESGGGNFSSKYGTWDNCVTAV